MARFNSKKSTKTINKAGGRAFSMNPEMELTHAVLTTFLDNKFYEDGNERLERIQGLVEKVDPKFVANLAVIARTEFNLRTVSHVLISELGKVHTNIKDGLVRNATINTIQRVDDITEIVSYLDGKLPRQIERGLRRALFKFNRYQLAKYRSEKSDWKLVDVFNLIHPKVQFANDEQKKAWEDLIKGKLISTDTWESRMSTEKDKTKVWSDLILEGKIGYMALLRNLNNLVKYNVPENIIDRTVQTLTDPEEVKKSRQLPFRFLTAFEHVQGNRKFSDAISEAMDIAVSNTPHLEGKTLIAIDSSGSMMGGYGNDKGAMEKASIFGATLAKANVNADVILFDTQVKELNLSTRTPVIDLANAIKNNANGGGTETSLVFRYAIGKNKVYDRIIIISDQESWVENGYGLSVQDFYNEYKKITDPFVYAIDIEGYGTKDVSGGKVFHLAGWSERLLDFIGRVEQGETLIDYIRNYEI